MDINYRCVLIRDLGNIGTHGELVTKSDAELGITNLLEIIDWYIDKYKTSKKIFATLVGTNTVSTQYGLVFKSLCDIAIAKGFTPSDNPLSVKQNQIPLDDWNLEQKGPEVGKTDFLLAVTAPKVPSMSPIPVAIVFSISNLQFSILRQKI